MALVTIQRSPTPTASPDEDKSQDDVIDGLSNECICSDGSGNQGGSQRSTTFRLSCASECYFAVKGAAVILPQNECIMMPRHSSSAGGEIQLHLQAMLHLLRPQDTLKMAVRLESLFGSHTRYMAIVSTVGRQDTVESLILGIDYVSREQTTIGLVLPIWASTSIALDGDGGISVESAGQQHVFKPVSVQAMWSVFQSLHKEHGTASAYPYYPGGLTHTWVQYYTSRLTSPEAFRSEWHYTFADESDLRVDSMERFREKPPERAAAEKLIRLTLKDVMQSVDLDEVTSKDIREKLEERLELDLSEYKEFIDQEMLVILGQMDKPSKIFEYLYLGTEWNASNWDELRMNYVGYILNVTKEVDNFFPGLFNYMKIRVSDEESSELIKHWDQSYKFIKQAKDSNCAVLVHCKKGINRSSSTVIAYAMKEYGWPLEKALNFVKEKRNCITPNKGFIAQLQTYNGMLTASRNRNNLLFTQPIFTTNNSSTDKPWGGLDEIEGDEKQETTAQTIPDMDNVEYTRKTECPMALTGLLVASENILKSCPGPVAESNSFVPSPSLDICLPENEQVQICIQQQSDVVFDEDTLPQLSTRLPLRRTLQNVEQKIKGQEDELTLKDVQQILMRSKRLSASQQSSSGASSMESETSSLESASGDEAEFVQRKPRRNSKSSNSDSTGDSAVADMTVLRSSPKFERCPQRASSNELYSAFPAMITRPRSLVSLDSTVQECLPAPGRVRKVTETYENNRASADKSKQTHKLGTPRRFFDKLFNRHGTHGKLPIKHNTKWYHRDRLSPTQHKSNTDWSQPKSNTDWSQPKVKHEKEKFERLSRSKNQGQINDNKSLLHSSDRTSVKRITSDLESKASKLNDSSAGSKLLKLTGNASEDNMVRSLVGVFESSSGTSSVKTSKETDDTTSPEPFEGPFPPARVHERRFSQPPLVTFHLGSQFNVRRSGSTADLNLSADFLPDFGIRPVRSFSLIEPNEFLS